MIVQEKLADASAAAPAGGASETLTSWQSRSCDELRAIASRGIQAGDLFVAAVKELERRAHDSEAAIEAERAVAVARRREIILLATILFAALAVAGFARLLGY
jgi:hypothetical protein